MSQPLATLITGASSGIGAALARQLAAKEQQTLVLVARRKDKLETLANELRSQHGVRVEVIGLDLEQVGAATQLISEVEKLGLSVDMLINNAGFGYFDLLQNIDTQKFRAILETNVVGAMLCGRECAKYFIEKKILGPR